MAELRDIELSFDKIKNEPRVSTPNPWLDPNFNRIDPWGKEPGIRVDDIPERLGLIQQGQKLDLSGNTFVQLKDTPSTYGINEQFVRTDGLGNLTFDWPYWVKTGSTIYYKKGKVAVGLSAPAVQFHTYGDNILDGAVTINESGRDKDFRVEGDSELNLFFTDASLDVVCIGTNVIGGSYARFHIVSLDGKLTGATYAHPGIDVIIEGNAQAGLQITSGTDGYVIFADDDSNPPAGTINYDHANEQMDFGVGTNILVRLEAVTSLISYHKRIYLDSPSYAAFTADSTNADAFLALEDATVRKWTVGFDYSDSRKFKICEGIMGTNTRLEIEPGASGLINLYQDIGIRNSQDLRFYDNGNYVGFKPPALSADQIWVLPSADGNANEALGTDGSGNLIWRDHGELPGLADDDHPQYGERTQTESITGLWTFNAVGGSGLTGYDLLVGDTVTPDYGLIRMGDSVIGRVPYNAMSMDLDGAVIIRNLTAPATSNIEFAFLESGGTSVRFALAKSAVGNATYNPRSMLIAGPAVWNDDIVTVGYWQTNNNIFDNLACDTAGSGADLGVQNDLEVEGDIFTDSIKESTSGAGITVTGKVGLGTAALSNAVLHLVGGNDAVLATADSGYLILGATNSTNMVIDDNEIMARNNGSAALLGLQTEGGDTRIGQGKVFINRASSSDVTIGIIIDQGANDDKAFALASSDVNHGVTNQVETDVYSVMQKFHATDGGLTLGGFTGGSTAFQMFSVVTTENSTKSTSGVGILTIDAFKKSGAGVGAISANANLVSIRGWTGSAYATRWIADNDGNTWQSGTVSCGGPLTITQNSDTIELSHDGTDAFFKTSDGAFTFLTTEGTNTHTIIYVKGKGTGGGQLRLYDADNSDYLILSHGGGSAFINSSGSGQMTFQEANPSDIKFWPSVSSGNPYFSIYGWDTGTASVQYARMNVDASGDFSIDIQSGNLLIPSGDVGIGESVPHSNTTVHIKTGDSGIADSQAGTVLTLETASAGNYVNFLSANTEYQGIVFGDTQDADVGYILYYHNDNSMIFRTNATTQMTIDSSGNVGLGTASQQEKLAVVGNIALPKASGNGIKIDNTTPTFGWRDLLGDQFAKNTGGTKPTLAGYNGAVDAWQFSDGDEAFLTFHIPHDYVAGTDIHLHIHWSQINIGATGGTIDFKYFAIYAKGHNQASGSAFTNTPITASFSSININDGGSGLTQYQQHLTEVVISAATATAALFDRDDFEPDGVIELTLEMDANSLTGTPSDPFIHYVDLHYQSTNIGTKDKVPDFYA